MREANESDLRATSASGSGVGMGQSLPERRKFKRRAEELERDAPCRALLVAGARRSRLLAVRGVVNYLPE